MSSLARTRTSRQHHGSDERYTPPWLLERVTAFLGSDWFDPCPASYGRAPTVNGLAVPWQGCVYCNPPYSRIAPWTVKFLTEPFEEGLMLVSAHTDTKWFAPLFSQTVLFLAGRVYFVFPDGSIFTRSPFGSALIYRGPRPAVFARDFGDLGAIVRPFTPRGAQRRTKLLE